MQNLLPSLSLMADPTRGGRGKVAPYRTTHYRIPVPIKPLIEQIAAVYRQCEPTKADDFLEALKWAINNLGTKNEEFKSREEIEKAIRKTLIRKKSARESMELLIEYLYQKD